MPSTIQQKRAAPVNLQNLIIAPRAEGGLEPKLDTSKLSPGSDGIVYKLVEPEDTKKFKVLSERELLRESQRVQDASTLVWEQSGQFKNIQKKKKMTPHAKFVPPQASKSRLTSRAEKSKW